MTTINIADAVYLGASKADRIYSGAKQVWPEPMPLTPILDDFNRADGDPGPNWIAAGFDWCESGMAIAGSELATISGQPYGSNAWHQPFPGDQEVYADVCDPIPAGMSNTLLLNACIQQPSIDVPNSFPAESYQLCVRGDNTAYVTRDGQNIGATFYEAGNPVQAGDTYLLRVSKGVLSAWWGRAGTWRKVVETTDTTYDSGYIGVEAWVQGQAIVVDNFGGGPI